MVDAVGGLVGILVFDTFALITGVGVGAVAGGLLLLAIMMRDADKFDGVSGRRSGGGVWRFGVGGGCSGDDCLGIADREVDRALLWIWRR